MVDALSQTPNKGDVKMNKQDAIKCLKSIQKWVPDWDDREDGLSYWDAIDMAIDALDPPNEPLTFAELREMEGEPVWVEHNNGGEWLVIHWDYVGRITTAYKACLLDHEYGRTWLAYCHPPEEETDE